MEMKQNTVLQGKPNMTAAQAQLVILKGTLQRQHHNYRLDCSEKLHRFFKKA